MAYSNGKITAPVSMTDISQALGSTQDLSRSPNINPMAKFKSVRKTFTLGSRPSDWWKADDGWCGLDITDAKVSNTSDVSNITLKYSVDKKNGWKHAAPRKGIDASRMLDFEGYNHNAQPFVGGYTMPNKWSKDDGTFDVSFMLTVDGATDADYLSYKDLPLENFYLGIALVGDSNNKVYRLTNANTIENSGFTIEVNVANIEAGNYTAYPFMSNKPMTILDGGFVVTDVYTLPNCEPTPLEVLLASIRIQIQGIFSDTADANGMYSMTYTVTITNNSQLDRKYNNNYIQLRYDGKKFTDVLDSTEKQQELNLGREIEVKANSSTTIYGVFGSIVPALQADAIIWVSLNSTEYLQSAVPQQNIRPEE